MGSRPNGNGYTNMAWIATVGGMVRAGTTVQATCRKCGVTLNVDLAPLLVRLGPNGTLLDRHPKCRVFGCDGRVVFHASPGAGTPHRPCITKSG